LAASISLDKAVINDKVITVSGKVYDEAKNQNVVVMASDMLSGSSYNDVRYLNQFSLDDVKTDAASTEYGKTQTGKCFEISFDIKELLSDDKIYVVRVGGTDIDNPAEMIITTLNGEAEVMLGDVNLDGKITAADAALTLQYVLFHMDYLTKNQVDAMKVTNANIITAENAAQILAKVLNSMYTFPVNQ
jgi:hypothetical protein